MSRNQRHLQDFEAWPQFLRQAEWDDVRDCPPTAVEVVYRIAYARMAVFTACVYLLALAVVTACVCHMAVVTACVLALRGGHRLRFARWSPLALRLSPLAID